MESENGPPQPSPSSESHASGAPGSRHRVHRRRRRKRVSDHAPQAHAICDVATEWLLYVTVVFSAWALGSAPNWAFWTTQVASCLLGALWLAKLVIRRVEEYQPRRWGDPRMPEGGASGDAAGPRPVPLTTRLLAGATLGLLGYVLVGALNARGTWDPASGQIRALDGALSFLPGTEDRGASWRAFIQLLGLASVFWAARDWLLQRAARDGKDAPPAPQAPSVFEPIAIPYRLRRLLWVLALHAAALATVAILHRADGAEDILWLAARDSEGPGERAFGPWSYATHGAQYFNLLWPLCLGFWLWLHERALRSVDVRKARVDGPQLVLVPATAIAGSAAMLADGQGGTLVAAIAGLVVVLLALLVSRRHVDRFSRTALVAFMAFGALVYAGIHWRHLLDQLGRMDRRYLSNIEVGNGDFTLLTRLRLPSPDEGGVPQTLVSLGGQSDGPLRTNALALIALPTGGLRVSLHGASPADSTHYSVGTLPASTAQREITVAVIRQAALRLLVNGVEISTTEHQLGEGTGVRAQVRSRYLAVQNPAVREIALANFALAGDALAAAARNPLGAIAPGLGLGPLASRDLANATNELQFPAGTQAALVPRPTTPNQRWLAIRRTSASGALGFSRSLAGLDPRLLTPASVSLRVWNQGDAMLRLSGSLRQGPRSTVEVEPRSEATIAIPLLPGGTDAEPSLEIAVTDAHGTDVVDLPMGTQLYLRDVQLQVARTYFSQRLDDSAPLAVLRDQVAGRGDLARNARRMAADHGFLGSGAGSFRALYSRYRQPDQQPAAAAGNDWLELRITLGWFGLLAALGALASLVLKSFFERGVPTLSLVLGLFWLSLATCAFHALFDQPFHSPAIALLAMVVAAMLSALAPARRE